MQSNKILERIYQNRRLLITMFLTGFLGIFFIVSFIFFNSFLDFDIGFHFKLGELFSRSQFQWSKDPFTYTMPGYIYKSHEWMSELIIYRLNSSFGMTSLAFICSVITLLSIIIIIPKRLIRWAVFPMFYSLGLILSFTVGVRLQVISWLFFSILARVLLDKNIFLKYHKLLPILFLFWANLHGSVIVGIILYGLILATDFIETKKAKITFWTMWIIAIIATFINPYGFALWQEIFSTLRDARLHYFSLEWRPLIFVLNPSMVPILALAIFIFIYYRRIYNNREKAIYLLIWLITLVAVRNFVFWILISNYIIAKGLASFYYDTLKKTNTKTRLVILYLGLAIYGVITISVIAVRTYGTGLQYQERNFYPKSAIYYIQKKYSDKKIFTSFEWGGYLIWKLEGYKGFIDGRMPSWRSKNISTFESKYAFAEYVDIKMGRSNYQRLFDKYKVELLLLPKSEVLLIEKLKDSPWTLEYKDKTALIYIKKSEL